MHKKLLAIVVGLTFFFAGAGGAAPNERQTPSISGSVTVTKKDRLLCKKIAKIVKNGSVKERYVPRHRDIPEDEDPPVAS